MYKYYITLIGVLFLFTSCSEEQIQLSPISQDSTGNFYKAPEDIEKAVVATYDALQLRGQYGENYFYVMEVRSDNSRQQSTTNSGGVFADIDLFRIEPTSPVMDRIWSDAYKGIQRCNIVLNRVESISDNPNKNTQKGEVKFIRALTYFNLVRIFGDVPLVTVEYDDPFEAFEIGRTPKTDVYQQIITDLTEASQELSSSPSRIGGATKSSANALLAKVQLTLGNYAEAITALRLVTGTLLTNYADNFGVANENSDESLFEIQFTKGGKGEGSPFANLFSPAGATELIGGIGITRGDNLPTQDLYDFYESGDLRKDVTIGTASTGVLHTKKYLDVPSSDRDADNNVIVLRYADVLLMLAEALNEQGYVTDGEAFDLLNQIRNRAGLGSLDATDLPNQSSFRDAVARERRAELAFENHRWFDLVRTGKAVEVMNAHTSVTGTLETVTTDNLVYPIPQSQIDASDKITPNPGY